MKFSDLIRTASSNMLRSKLRTFLTISAIFIGAMTITLTNGIGTGIKSYLNSQIGNLGATNVLQIQQTSSPSSGISQKNNSPAVYNPNQKISAAGNEGPGAQQVVMTQKDINNIEKIPNITGVVPERNISPDYITTGGQKYQLSIEQQYGITTASMLAGGGVNNQADENQLTIPQIYVNSLGFGSSNAAIGKTVTIAITSAEGVQSTVKATIVGVEQKALIGASIAYANTSLATQLFDIQSTGLPSATINEFSTVDATFPANLTQDQINTIKGELQVEGYTGTTIKDAENTIFTIINVIIIVFDMFGGIALLAASFGIINTLFMSVQERTKEIGLMKALGMSSRKIFTLFSIEAILIGFWGSLLGVAFASLLGSAIDNAAKNGFLKDFPGLSLLTFPLSTVAVVIIGIMLIAFLAGTLPAIRASRKDPIEALRYE